MFKSVKLSVLLDEFGKIELNVSKKNELEFEIEKNEYVEGNLYLKETDGSYIVKCDISTIAYPYDYFRCFDTYSGIILEFMAEENTKIKGLAIERFNPFWTKPVFFDDFSQVTDNTHQVLIENGNEYIHIMPISGATIQTCACKSENKNILTLRAGAYFGGSTKLSGALAVISKGDNPYKTVEKSYNMACENEIILTPLKAKKTYPKHLEGLGWCTWNAFYHDVTAEGIEKKLIEFREKNIPIKWIMIDDGWAMTEDFKLKSGCVDKNKFPDGLKAFIKHIKQKYGIEYVGIWHSFTGYWFGIDKNGELYNKDSDLFTEHNSGLVLPGNSFDQAYKFYSDWHKYLKDEGIDFLKVDCQGNALQFYKNTKGVGEAVVNLHNALEKSVMENFGGVMINCMGMGNLDMFSRQSSAVIRNSDDFFPDKEDGFLSHITQNAYNAVFNDNLYMCDFDMWWTKHISAKQSSVLRAISGGPVYVSDEVGNTDREYLMPIIDENGKIIRCDNAAKPTADCLFENPHDGILKLFNTIGESIVIAVFNLSDTKKKTKINLKDIYAIDNYHMYRYFAKAYDDFADGFEIEVEANDVEIINLHKIGVNFENTDKYIC